MFKIYAAAALVAMFAASNAFSYWKGNNNGYNRKAAEVAAENRKRDGELFDLADRLSDKIVENEKLNTVRDTLLRGFEDNARLDANAGCRAVGDDGVQQLNGLFGAARSQGAGDN